jgi:hypothetical protein
MILRNQQLIEDLQYFCDDFMENLEEQNTTAINQKQFSEYCILFSKPFKQSQKNSILFINQFCSITAKMLYESPLNYKVSHQHVLSLCELFVSVFF